MNAYVPYCQCRLGPPHVWEPDGACPPARVEPPAEAAPTEEDPR